MPVDSKEAHRGLAALGLSEQEVVVYARLLESKAGSAGEVARAAELSVRRARHLLGMLEDKGLVTRSPTKESRFFPAPPEDALAILTLRRQEELHEARVTAASFLEELWAFPSPSGSERIVEVLGGWETVNDRWLQMLAGAREEILGFCTHPMGRVDEEATKWKLDKLTGGVRGRAIYDLEILKTPGIVDFIRAVGPAGEEARTVSKLPMPLIIVDRRAALLPLTPSRRSIHSDYLLVHESSLLEGLVMLFDSVWDRASRFDVGEADQADRDDPDLSPDDVALLRLLDAGLKEGAIAKQFNVVPRTIERRVNRIMDRLGKSTRFQAGAEAQRRGWLGRQPVADE